MPQHVKDFVKLIYAKRDDDDENEGGGAGVRTPVDRDGTVELRDWKRKQEKLGFTAEKVNTSEYEILS